MKDSITVQSEFSQLLLLGQTGPVVMMEGPDDKLIFDQIVIPQVHLISSSGGKSRLLAIAKIALEANFNLARFVIDSDYDMFDTNANPYPNNVVYSTHHDCFIDLIADDLSPLTAAIYSKLAQNIRVSERYSSFDRHTLSKKLLKDAIEIASAKGVVKLMATQLSIRLNFESYNVRKEDLSQISPHKIYRMISSSCKFSEAEIDQHIKAIDIISPKFASSFPRIGDHDLLRAVCRLLSDIKIQIGEAELRNLTLHHVNPRTLQDTQWCRQLLRWCSELGLTLFKERTSISYHDL